MAAQLSQRNLKGKNEFKIPEEFNFKMIRSKSEVKTSNHEELKLMKTYEIKDVLQELQKERKKMENLTTSLQLQLT